MSDLCLFKDYAQREGISFDEAKETLIEQMEDYDNPEEFLDDIGFEHDYVFQVIEYML